MPVNFKIQSINVFILLVSLLILALFVDQKVSVFIETIPKTPGLQTFKSLTFLGEGVYYVVPYLSLTLGLTFWLRVFRNTRGQSNIRIWRNYFGFCLLAFSLAGILVNIIKPIIGRARPHISSTFENLIFQPFEFHMHYESFPSGHAQGALSFAFLMTIILPRWRWIFYLYAVAMASTRLLINVHFVSDIVGGFVVAWVGLQVAESIFRRWGILEFKPKL